MSILNEYVIIDKETASGVPIFRNTRVTVKTLFDHLIESSIEEFLEGFPSVSWEQAVAVIEQASVKFLFAIEVGIQISILK